MANPNGKDPNTPKEQPVIGQVHGGRLFEDDVEDYDEWGPEVGRDGWPGGQREQQAKDEGERANPEVAQLKGQVEQLTKTLERMQQQTMLQQAPQPQQPQQQAQPEPEEEELPDPFEDPKGYAAAIERNVRARIEAEQQQERQQQQAQQSEQQKTAELWNDFTIKHKDYADDPERVEFAARKVAQRAAKRGIDLNRYMFVHRDQFMDDVVEEIDRIFGGQKGNSEQGAQDNPQDPPAFVPDRQAPPQTAAPNPGRTQGMFGGMNQGNRPAPGEDSGPSADPFGDIREFQMRTGFHR